MAETRKEKFERSKRVRKEAKKQYTGGDYVEIKWVAIEEDEPATVRILGDLPTGREKGSDIKQVAIAYFKDDAAKMMRVIFPMKDENPNWILYKVYNKVMEYKWNKVAKSKTYKHDVTHPTLFSRVSTDNSENIYAKGWYPKPTTLMNVLDRNDTEWHEREKHTKLLSKGSWTVTDDNGEEIKRYTEGVPNMLFDIAWDGLTEDYGDWIDYDVLLKKKKETPWYFALYPKNDAEYPITEEEMAYEMYDLDELFKITSYGKIKTRLGKFIQKVDKAFKTTFYEDLCESVEQEEIENKEKADKEEKENPKPKEEKVEKDVEEETTATPEKEIEEEKPAPKTRTRKAPKTVLDDVKEYEKAYPFYSKLTASEKATIKGLDKDGKFIYEYKKDDILDCMDKDCDCVTPDNFKTCPKCGTVFSEVEEKKD